MSEVEAQVTKVASSTGYALSRWEEIPGELKGLEGRRHVVRELLLLLAYALEGVHGTSHMTE